MEISRLYLRGYTQAQIADEIGVDPSTVSRDIAVLIERWKTSANNNVSQHRQFELDLLDELEKEYKNGWERSKTEARQQKASKRKRGADGSDEQATMTTETQVGDPRFLDGIRSVIADRRRLLGLDAPTKIAQTDPTGEHSYAPLTDEERLTKLAALIESAATKKSR